MIASRLDSQDDRTIWLIFHYFIPLPWGVWKSQRDMAAKAQRVVTIFSVPYTFLRFLLYTAAWHELELN